MTDEEAKQELLNCMSYLSFRDTKLGITTKYPELVDHYWNYILGNMAVGEFTKLAVDYIKLANTKLYKILND